MTREQKLEKALKAAQRLIKEALPKFNWGASCLDANAITLLNEVPLGIEAALAEPVQPMTHPYEQGYSDGFGTGWQDAREAAVRATVCNNTFTTHGERDVVFAAATRIRALVPTKEETK
jgi:hypothetical protein